MSVITIGTKGLEAFPVFIEADIGRGLFNFNIVGLGDKAVTESKSRILAALKNSGFVSPKTAGQKITILLGPADIKKEGSHFDLPIAIAYLETCKYIETLGKKVIAAVGELSLDGRVRPVRNILLMVLSAKNLGYKKILVPTDNFLEASLVEGILIIGIETLKDVVNILSGVQQEETKNKPAPELSRKNTSAIENGDSSELLDIDTVIGQTEAKRALEIALAGKHHIAFYGPPGVGKTLLAKAASELLPPLSKEEAVLHSILEEAAGQHNHNGILIEEFYRPPFRDPHHTSSYSSILGTPYRLGELSLAHSGILFMDEFAEFDRRALESLRQPMEDGHIKSHRAGMARTLPADSILIAATNLCKCGNYRSTIKRCTCSALNIEQYIKRISGPLADRIDLWVAIQEQNSGRSNGQSPDPRKATDSQKQIAEGIKQYIYEGKEMKKRIAEVRKIQEDRLLSLNIEPKTLFKSNKRKARVLLLKNIRKTMHVKVKKILDAAVKNLALSARGADSVLAVARTIADIENSATIQTEHILEALTYRKKF